MERLPKWEPTGRSRVYLGNYHVHSGSVEFVLNIITGSVSPQYHVVFYKTLSTVYHTRKGTLRGNWKNMVEEHSDIATQEKFTLEK